MAGVLCFEADLVLPGRNTRHSLSYVLPLGASAQYLVLSHFQLG
jgi:hypothetical protein